MLIVLIVHIDPGTTWAPDDDADDSRLAAYLRWLTAETGVVLDSYEAAWSWSTEHVDDFWHSLWEFMDGPSAPTGVVRTGTWYPEVSWFPTARLNWAEEVLTVGAPDDLAIVARSQTRERTTLTRRQLRDEVARVRAGLLRAGVTAGDRVFGYVPNIPEAIVALLATASIGATWAACPPEFGAQSVIDRAAQVDPTVLVAVNGYRYGARTVERDETVAAIRASLPGLRTTVSIDYLDTRRHPAGAVTWDELRSRPGPLDFDRVAFEHPLWILFSSGTTGLPKAIVHGHGGITLEHFKIGALMQDIRPDSRYFAFSSTAWMVWNRLVSVLMTGAAIVLFDGDPAYPDLSALPRVLEDEGVTHWGSSATYLEMCRLTTPDPFEGRDLTALRSVISAGSPCTPEVYAYIGRDVRPGVQFYEGSGGTDVCTGFVSGTPLSPVVDCEIPARMLGVAAYAFDDHGRPVLDEPGELVITQPMPSMPLFFWGDDDGSRYRASYFERFPGVWHHGDRFLLRPRGTCKVLGRSDATLNRSGVRLGAAEFYSIVEPMNGIRDALVVHVPGSATSPADELLLFVELDQGAMLDDDLRAEICRALRDQRSARHVPNGIHAVRRIPYTHSGKKLEVPVKRILMGEAPDDVANPGSLRDPDSLGDFVELAQARAHRG